MNLIASALVLFSILVPTKTWYTPKQPIEIKVQADQPVQLVMKSFAGKDLDAEGSTEVAPGTTVDVKKMFPQMSEVGTYVLFAVPKGKTVSEFVGTPLVIQARQSPRATSAAIHVYKVAPLTYVTIQTEKGPIKAALWYDAAPQTVSNFVDLAQGGYFDGQTFHRIVPGFVIQGGDPTGTGFGGPGYTVQAEFNDRTHEEGVLSMARTGDPLEGRGISPRSEFANSAGSQFFICLSREKCQSLDRKYTAFGKVFDGMDAVNSIAAAELADPSSGAPKQPQPINAITVVPVTAKDNPYATMLKMEMAGQPAAPEAQVAPAVKADPVPATQPQ